jgi:hypothetical protein
MGGLPFNASLFSGTLVLWVEGFTSSASATMTVTLVDTTANVTRAVVSISGITPTHASVTLSGLAASLADYQVQASVPGGYFGVLTSATIKVN